MAMKKYNKEVLEFALQRSRKVCDKLSEKDNVFDYYVSNIKDGITTISYKYYGEDFYYYVNPHDIDEHWAHNERGWKETIFGEREAYIEVKTSKLDLISKYLAYKHVIILIRSLYGNKMSKIAEIIKEKKKEEYEEEQSISAEFKDELFEIYHNGYEIKYLVPNGEELVEKLLNECSSKIKEYKSIKYKKEYQKLEDSFPLRCLDFYR